MKLFKGWELAVVMVLVLAGWGYSKIIQPYFNPVAVKLDNAGKQVNDPCKNTTGDRRDCYEKFFDGVVMSEGPKEALRQLKILSSTDKVVEADCHPIVHSIGHSALKYYKKDVAKSLADASEVCASGYYHGVLESYMTDFSDDQLLAQLNKICHSDGRLYSSAYFSCIHGLGHGLTIRFDMQVFKALPYCDSMKDDWHKQSCFGGVFMQNIVADLQPEYHRSVDLKPEDPVYPCNAVREDQKTQCYGMVSSYILRVNQWDYDKSFAVCDKVERNYVSICYQSMGRDISGTALLDANKVIENCNKGRVEMRQNCFIGAAKNAVYNDGAVGRADQLCAAVEPAYRLSCRSARDEIAASL